MMRPDALVLPVGTGIPNEPECPRDGNGRVDWEKAARKYRLITCTVTPEIAARIRSYNPALHLFDSYDIPTALWNHDREEVETHFSEGQRAICPRARISLAAAENPQWIWEENGKPCFVWGNRVLLDPRLDAPKATTGWATALTPIQAWVRALDQAAVSDSWRSAYTGMWFDTAGNWDIMTGRRLGITRAEYDVSWNWAKDGIAAFDPKLPFVFNCLGGSPIVGIDTDLIPRFRNRPLGFKGESMLSAYGWRSTLEDWWYQIRNDPVLGQWETGWQLASEFPYSVFCIDPRAEWDGQVTREFLSRTLALYAVAGSGYLACSYYFHDPASPFSLSKYPLQAARANFRPLWDVTSHKNGVSRVLERADGSLTRCTLDFDKDQASWDLFPCCGRSREEWAAIRDWIGTDWGADPIETKPNQP